MRAPACDAGDCENWGIQLYGQVEHAVYKAAVEIDIGADAFVDAALLGDDFRGELGNGGIDSNIFA